ncbi:MAG: hypothetical protein ACXU86_03810, partial [Archangium sp.]
DEVPYGSDTLAQKEGIGTSPVIPAGPTTDAAWMNAGERTGQPFGRPEELRTQDLGDQNVGPFNTEGARASPILTEEDRAFGTPLTTRPPIEAERGVGIPIYREGVVERPAMSASPTEVPPVMAPPARAEEESARVRAMTDEDLPVVHDELYDEPRRLETRGKASEEDTRKLDLSGESDPNKPLI